MSDVLVRLLRVPRARDAPTVGQPACPSRARPAPKVFAPTAARRSARAKTAQHLWTSASVSRATRKLRACMHMHMYILCMLCM